MSIKRVKTLNKNQQKDIFNFNHIDPSIEPEELEKIKEFYKFYHKKFWCLKKAFKHFKKMDLALTLASTGLVVVGTIVGGITLNPIILGVVSGAGLGLKTFQEIKDHKKKIVSHVQAKFLPCQVLMIRKMKIFPKN